MQLLIMGSLEEEESENLNLRRTRVWHDIMAIGLNAGKFKKLARNKMEVKAILIWDVNPMQTLNLVNHQGAGPLFLF